MFGASWIRILLSQIKISKKNLDSYCFLTFYLWKWWKCTFKSNKQKTFFLKINFLLTPSRSMTTLAGSGSISYRHGDPRIQIRIRILTKMSWVRDTGQNTFQAQVYHSRSEILYTVRQREARHCYIPRYLSVYASVWCIHMYCDTRTTKPKRFAYVFYIPLEKFIFKK
jgi:hypothetical protein